MANSSGKIFHMQHIFRIGSLRDVDSKLCLLKMQCKGDALLLEDSKQTPLPFLLV